MAIIVAIPSYYRTDSYVYIPKGNERPTTTARYIVLTPAASETLTARNTAIAKDVTEWGWHVYNTDPSAPNMEKWFEKYDKAAKNSTWDDDIWKIWQREHGLRISVKDAECKGKIAFSGGKRAKVKHEVKKAAIFVGKFVVTMDYYEFTMRGEEAWKEGERSRKDRERRTRVADEQSVEVSTLGMSTVLPGDPFADPPIQRRWVVEEGGFKSGNLRGGDGGGGKGDLVEKPAATDQQPLTRHSWLL